MRYWVTRTDTGQFVCRDPVTETVVIDDDCNAAFTELERIVANAPPANAPPASIETPPPSTTSGSASSKGRPQLLVLALASVVSFAWLAAFYLVMTSLLARYAVEHDVADDDRARVESLAREIEAVRTELRAAPTSAKPKPTPKPTPKPARAPAADADEQAQDSGAR